MSDIIEPDIFITPEFSKNLTLESAKFIFEHSEKTVKETAENNTVIITRLLPFATITVTAMVALSGFAINRWDVNKHAVDTLLLTSLITIIYLLIISALIVYMLLPTNYHTPGARPKEFFRADFMNETNKADLERLLYINEIENYQMRIKLNIETSDKRWFLFKTILIMLLSSPIVAIISYKIAPYITSCG